MKIVCWQWLQTHVTSACATFLTFALSVRSLLQQQLLAACLWCLLKEKLKAEIEKHDLLGGDNVTELAIEGYPISLPSQTHWLLL